MNDVAGEADKPPVDHDATAPHIVGSVDNLVGFSLYGWSMSPDQPLERLSIAVTVDGEHVATDVADRFRPDLLTAERGDGRHGFNVKLPPHLFDGAIRSVQVLASAAHASLLFEARQFTFEPQHQDATSGGLADLYVLFDAGFYTAQAGSVTDPFQHYITEGWKLGFNPHPLFDSAYYVSHYADQITGDPLTHFLQAGRWQNHSTHPLFDVVAYGRARPDVIRAGHHPLLHYLQIGWKESVPASPFFDEEFYEVQCPGIRELGFAPLVHYLHFGWLEGKKPHPDFDPPMFHELAGLEAHREPYTHFVSTLLAQRERPTLGMADGGVETSIVILNFNKPLLTLQCLYFLDRHTDLTRSEIIIVDNGSAGPAFQLLCQFATGCRIIRLGANRGFGEGNNLGAEAACGEFLVFMNNDAFATRDWLRHLLHVVHEDPATAAVGAKLIYPDGRLQEAGAMVASCGTALQRGKYLDSGLRIFNTREVVDYCSAATLLVRRASFLAVLGFDLCWDPAYFEDADLCLKLRLLGQRTIYEPAAVIVHLENATSSDAVLDLRLHDIVGINRLKFVSRWSRFLTDGARDDVADLIPPRLPHAARPGLRDCALYTPYPLHPGGGERYFLSIAAALSRDFHVTVITPDHYSQCRLATLGRELAIDLSAVRLVCLRDIPLGTQFEIFVAMGNEVFPSIRGMGRRNFYHCQFPFPFESTHVTEHWGHLATYDGVLVNSAFTASHLAAAAARMNLTLPPCHVLNPPVPQMAARRDVLRQDAPLVILHVGRFAPGGHCKRQDVMIAAFRELTRATQRPIELHLAGAIGSDSASREYLAALQKAARGAPVVFHVNCSARQIQALYLRASIYWHMTGVSADLHFQPELFEHFGITIGEAMSAGVVPVVLRHGGPSEIVSHGKDGMLVSNAAELQRVTAELLDEKQDLLAAMSRKAMKAARRFAPEHFAGGLRAIMGIETVQPAAAPARSKPTRSRQNA